MNYLKKTVKKILFCAKKSSSKFKVPLSSLQKKYMNFGIDVSEIEHTTEQKGIKRVFRKNEFVSFILSELSQYEDNGYYNEIALILNSTTNFYSILELMKFISFLINKKILLLENDLNKKVDNFKQLIRNNDIEETEHLTSFTYYEQNIIEELNCFITLLRRLDQFIKIKIVIEKNIQNNTNVFANSQNILH